ncbi:MAG: hypothetical protein PF961_23635, partial [Planctomycetota bacterium]|nr:hypothetical protein [Planctomycetota bacterium]
MERRSRTTRISREKDEPTTRQQRRPGLLPSALIQRIGQDPVFQVATSDAGHWIHPYTGEAVAVIETVRKTAERSLSVDGTWRDGEPYSLGELEILRWKHELVEAIPREERLRLFAKDDRGWLNPYSGEFYDVITLYDDRCLMVLGDVTGHGIQAALV